MMAGNGAGGGGMCTAGHGPPPSIPSRNMYTKNRYLPWYVSQRTGRTMVVHMGRQAHSSSLPLHAPRILAKVGLAEASGCEAPLSMHAASRKAGSLRFRVGSGIQGQASASAPAGCAHAHMQENASRILKYIVHGSCSVPGHACTHYNCIS